MSRRLPPWLPDALALVLVAGLIARRWWQMGPFPTGLDGGQWLALGHGLMGAGRATAGAYAPLVPTLAVIGEAVFGPSLGLKLIALGSFAAILVVIWRVARDGLGPWPGLSVTALVGPATALTEPLAFGGYPQQVALAALLLGAWSLARYLATGGRRWLPGIACGLGLAALSHHIYYPLALGVTAVIGLLWLTGAPPRAVVLHRGARAVGVAGLSGVLFLPTAYGFLTADYAPPLAAAGLDLQGAWHYGTREAVPVWMALAVVAIASLALTAPGGRRDPAWQVTVALILMPGLLFVLTGEARLLPPVLIGIGLGVGYGTRRLIARQAPAARGAGHWAALPAAVALALPLLLLRGADGEATAFFRFYQVLDQSLLDVATAITAAQPTGFVAVRTDARGWPVGWWLEGLTPAPIAVGSDPRWLGFPAERERARVVASLFAPGLTAPQVRDLAREHDIELIVLRKWDWIGWQRWQGQINAPLSVLFDDGEHLVLRVRPE